MRDLLRAKLGELDERMEAMRKFRGTLAGHLAACERELRLRGKTARCPVIVEITQTGHPQRAVARKEKKRWKKKLCACPERNPSGAYCLGEVNKTVKRLLAEYQAASKKNLKEIGRGPCLNKWKRSQAWRIART